MTESSEGLVRLGLALGRAAQATAGGEPIEAVLEAPRSLAFGDFATNVALQLAKRARRAPQALATDIVARLFEDDPELRELVAEATPLAGFINLRMSAAYWQRTLAQILHAGPDFGRAPAQGVHVSLEFGSANPTGPLVIVQGRTLSLGDSLANVMRFRGLDVTTEWIVNDAGSQVETLGRSLYARYRQLAEPTYPFPEDGYPGSYLLAIAERIRANDGDFWVTTPQNEWLPHFALTGRDAIVEEQQATCRRFGVAFDRWQSEKELHASGAVEGAIARLRERELVFETDGALWMRATAFGDDKDRVVVRSDGRPTYYGADLAYHYDKLERTDRALLILGPDHHGYIARLRLIADLLGRPGAIDVMLAQQMTTIRDGQIVSLSKRHGDILTLDEVIDEVGVDAARFFFAASNADSPMTFDLTLAKEQSSENPVYYVQYGHARIASIERKAPPELALRAAAGEQLERLVTSEELALVRRLADFPATVQSVVDGLAPNRLARYAREVAADFHQFYMACTVLSDDEGLSVARLGLARATKSVLAVALGLLGVSAPDRMDRA